MSTAWFYFKGDQRIGPVGSFKLKDLTTNGNILPADLVWKEGMASPQPASTVKGLFEASIIPPPPLPVREKLVAPQQSTEDEQGHVTPSSFTAAAAPAKQAGLVDNLKSAGTWAIKQADLARTKNVSLPAALHSLGKSICDGDYGRVALAAEYDVVDELRKQIAAIADCARVQHHQKACLNRQRRWRVQLLMPPKRRCCRCDSLKRLVGLAAPPTNIVLQLKLLINYSKAWRKFIGKSAYWRQHSKNLPQRILLRHFSIIRSFRFY